MKKIAGFLAILLVFMLMVQPMAWAAEETTGEEPEENVIEIAFAVGDQTLSINGKDVLVETPYVVGDGVTLVPVRVITEAFGAEVGWDDATQTVTVSYREAAIKLVIGNKIATINGEEHELLAAPELKNDTTMLPLRFLSESFGADVTYDEETERITVTKEITISNSIKDYALILKRSEKEYVGDSYYNWSMKRTSDMKLVERSFDGTINFFDVTSCNGMIDLLLLPRDKEVGIEDYMEKYRQTNENYTTLELKESTSAAGVPYVHSQVKTKDSYIDHRTFLTDQTVYLVASSVEIGGGMQAFQQLTAIADTFDVKFQLDQAEDLSDLDSQNMHTYQSNDLGFEVKIPGNYLESSDDDISNEITFLHYDEESNVDSRIHIAIYSNFEGHTYKTWANNDFTINQNLYNPEWAVFKGLTEERVGNKPALSYEATINSPTENLVTKDVFVDLGDYFCNISMSVPNQEESLILQKQVIASLSFSEVDGEELGKMIRTDADLSKTKTFQNDELGFSIEAPSSWKSSTSSNGMILLDLELGRMVELVASPLMEGAYFDLAQAVQQIYDLQKEVKTNTMLDAMPSVNRDYGIPMRTFSYKMTANDGTTAIIRNYYFQTDDYVYSVTMFTPELYDGQTTKETFDQILNSFQEISQ